jgi:hypothetical protein
LEEALAKQGDCKWCGKKGHLHDTCFQKYPDKKPKWLKLKGSKTSEASASNLEVTLTSLQDFQVGLADAPQLSQVFQELSLCAVGPNDDGFDLVNVLMELAHSGISIEPIDITGAYMHQDLTVDRGDVSGDPITLPFVLSGSESSAVSDDLSEASLVSSNF